MEQNNLIDTIINKYLQNDFPEQIQSDFQEWITDSKNQKEKEEALFNKAFIKEDIVNYKQYQKKLKKLNNEIEDQRIRKINKEGRRKGGTE